MRPTSNGVARRRTPLNQQYRQSDRLAAGRGVDRWAIDPSNWINVLNALLKEHNHRHIVKAKDVSFKTMAERMQFFFRFFRELRSIGYRLDPRSIGTRHIQAAVNLWLERGLSPGTICNYLSYLSALGIG